MKFIRYVLFVIVLCASLSYTRFPLLRGNGIDDTDDIARDSGIFIDAPAPEEL